jgi:hypothetical protein
MCGPVCTLGFGMGVWRTGNMTGGVGVPGLQVAALPSPFVPPGGSCGQIPRKQRAKRQQISDGKNSLLQSSVGTD